jgi:hypothetical protein
MLRSLAGLADPQLAAQGRELPGSFAVAAIYRGYVSVADATPRLDVEPGNEAAPRDPDSIRAAMDTSCLRAVRICLRQLGPELLVKQLVTVLAQEHE